MVNQIRWISTASCTNGNASKPTPTKNAKPIHSARLNAKDLGDPSRCMAGVTRLQNLFRPTFIANGFAMGRRDWQWTRDGPVARSNVSRCRPGHTMPLTMSFQDAWAGYRRWEHRMPAKPPSRVARRVSGLIEVLEDFDVVILDNFGVLSLGPPAIPEGTAALEAIRAAGKPVRILTNDGAKGIEAMRAGHLGRGYSFGAEEIIPGYRLLERTLALHPDLRPWGVIGLDPLPERALTDAMIPLTNGGIARIEEVGGVVMLDAGDWSETDQTALLAAMRADPRPLIVCNPDLTAPYTDALSYEPGWSAHQLADATGVEPVFLGQAFPDIYDIALADFADIPRERVIAVGDTPHTDVLGAHAAGIKSLLVETGFTRGQDALALMREAGIMADFVSATV
jgi:glycerol 3-phosphatase-2